MHQDNMRLPANLRMNAHGEDESGVLPVSKVELLHPQLFNYVRVDIALSARSAGDGL